jgi:STE24 endopeptidase
VVQKYIAQHRKQAPKGEVNKEENDEIKLEETHKKTVNYNMDNMKLGFIADTIEFLQDVLMLYFNFMHVVYYFAAETLLKGWFGVQNPLEYEITTSIIVMIIMYLINQITTIPISLYHTFVLEEKYGFNKQTLRVNL